jgi:hypothetical protein
MAKQKMRPSFLGTVVSQKPDQDEGGNDLESIRSRWEKQMIENIHDKEAIAEKYGWQMVNPLIEMEIAQRKRKLQEDKPRSFSNSEQKKRVNRWLKRFCLTPNLNQELLAY